MDVFLGARFVKAPTPGAVQDVIGSARDSSSCFRPISGSRINNVAALTPQKVVETTALGFSGLTLDLGYMSGLGRAAQGKAATRSENQIAFQIHFRLNGRTKADERQLYA